MTKTMMAMAAVMGLAACGGGGSGGAGGASGTTSTTTGGGAIPCAQPADANSGRVPCPGGSPAPATALPTLAALRKIANGNGKPVKWLGGVLGQQIARDGTPTGGLLGLWTAGFCLGGTSHTDPGDALNLSTNGKECLAQDQCQTLDCTVSPDFPFPAVDADAAIKAAYPAEGATATYGLGYTATIGDFWTVTSLTAGTKVKVDGKTGKVIP